MLGVQVRLGSEVRGSVRQFYSTYYRLQAGTRLGAPARRKTDDVS